jgi:uncharacterized repeat protein (TIGR03803 family)
MMALRSFLAGAAALPCLLASLPAEAAVKFTTLHGFAPSVGSNPVAGLTETAAGALYGVTATGSTFFTLVPPAAGKTAWSLKVLYTFPSGGAGGLQPATQMLPAASGVLYGTTLAGGTNNVGVIYALVPPASGQTLWTETVLYDAASADGAPDGNLAFDGKGGLIGTNSGAANGTAGSVFDLTPPATGGSSWTYTPIYTFQGGGDGTTPNGGLVADKSGNFYGTTQGGGSNGVGTIFKLTPPATGQTAWTKTILYDFSPDYGVAPSSPLLFVGGVLYGEAGIGSPNNLGEVFSLTPPAKGKTAWTIEVLCGFAGTNGSSPTGGLVANSAGVLYGVTALGGATTDYGTVFSLTPPAAKGDDWTQTVLHSFLGKDGSSPTPLAIDPSGTLYGLTTSGYSKGYGSAYRLIP